MRKKIWIPIIALLATLVVLLSPVAHIPDMPKLPATDQSLGQLLHPSGNPFVTRFSDVKDIRTATFVVAASDSEHKFEADYYCNGTNDHLEILAALDALPATGGEVVLLDGTFNIEVSLVLDSYQTLSGQGRNTILTTTTASTDIIIATGGSGTEKIGIVISDLCIDGTAGASTSDNAITWTYVDYSKIYNVWCINNDEVAIQFSYCDHCQIVDNQLIGNGVGGNETIYLVDICTYCNIEGNLIKDDTGYEGIYAVCTHSTIINNIVANNGGAGIKLDYNSIYNVVDGNVVTDNSGYGENGIEIYDTGNIISNNFVSGSAGSGIFLLGVRNVIEGNICWGNTLSGIDCEASNQIINNNQCYLNGEYGIYCALDHQIVENNICHSNSQTTDNTYSNILIDDDYCLVQGNLCRQGAEANQPDYGIEVTATVDKAIISGNDLYDSGKTANFIDGGTLTHVEDNNRGIEITDVKMYRLVKNTSGGVIAAGKVVVLKAVAAGNEITTTVAADDEDVYGMIAETIADNASGLVLVKGKTTALKVSGTVAIAIGDRLSTHDAAGISQKAGVETAVFARALEAYAVDDDNGVIDAWLCSKWD